MTGQESVMVAAVASLPLCRIQVAEAEISSVMRLVTEVTRCR